MTELDVREMKIFTIEPNIGVGPIKLGMKREEVRIELGEPDNESEEREWYLGGIACDYNENGYLEFIELAHSNRFRSNFHGVYLHEVSAADALQHVTNYDKYKDDDPELGYSYVFLKLNMSLWRGTIHESNKDEDGKHFESVGIAVNGYFDEDYFS